MASVGVRLRNEANTSTTATLSSAFDVTFQPRANRNGTGSFKIPNSDTDTLAAIGNRSIVQFTLAGTARFAARVIDHEKVVVDSGREGVEATEFRCEGLRVDFDESGIKPPSIACDLIPSVDERVIGAWFSPDYDWTGWEAATQIAKVGWKSMFYTGQPAGFTDEDAYWVCASDGDEENAPEGYRPFVAVMAVGAGTKWVEWSADNSGEFYVMGRKVQSCTSYKVRSDYEFDTSSGYLTLAWWVKNDFDDGAPGGNPTSLVWSMREGGPEGSIIAGSSSVSTLTLPADGSWPNLRLGEIFRKCREGCDLLDLWTVHGTDSVDTEGNTYPRAALSFRYHEDSLGDLLKVYTDTWIDVTVDVSGKHLRPRVKGETGSTSTFELIVGYDSPNDPAVNALDLSWDVRPPEFDGIMLRDSAGWVPVGDGPRYKPYRVEQITDRALTVELGEELMSVFGVTRYTAAFEYLPIDEATDLPFVAFDVFDTLELPGPDGEPTPQVVQSIIVKGGARGDTRDRENGGGVFVEVGDPVTEREEMIAAQLSRLGGSLGGLGAAASGGKAPIVEALGAARRASVPEGAVRIVSDPTPEVRTVVATNSLNAWVVSLRAEGMTDGGTSTYDITVNGSTYTLSGSADGRFDVVSVGEAWDSTMPIEIDCTGVGHTNVNIYAEVARTSR